MMQASDEIVSYCKQFTSPDSLLLQKLSDETYKSEDIPQMVCGQLVGHLLNLLVSISKAQKILEIGTFTGYSALQMAEALPDSGRLFTCELMEKHIQTAQNWFDKSPYGSKISILKGSALNSIEQFKNIIKYRNSEKLSKLQLKMLSDEVKFVDKRILDARNY